MWTTVREIEQISGTKRYEQTVPKGHFNCPDNIDQCKNNKMNKTANAEIKKTADKDSQAPEPIPKNRHHIKRIMPGRID